MKKVLIFSLLLLIFSNCSQKQDLYTRELKQSQSEQYQIEEELKNDIIEIGDWAEEINENKRKTGKIKAGILLPLSGKAQKIGKIMLQSAQLALFESKKNNIILAYYDTKGTSFGALEAINKAVEENVDIILGPLFNATTEAIIDVAYDNNIPVLSFSNNQLLLNNKNVYLMGFTPEQEIERIVTHMMNENKYAFSALLPNDKYGSLIAKTLKETVERKDGTIVKIDFYLKNDKSLDQKVKNILEAYSIPERIYEEYEKEKELSKLNGEEKEVEFTFEEEDKIYADAILIPEGGKKLTKIVDIIKDYSLDSEKEYKLLGSSKWHGENNYNNEDLYGAWFASPNPKKFEEFEKRFYTGYNEFPIRIASLAYDSINVVKKVYSKSKGQSIDIEYLTNEKGFKGIDGRFRFLPNGIVERRFAVLEINNGYAQIVDESLSGFLDY